MCEESASQSFKGPPLQKTLLLGACIQPGALMLFKNFTQLRNMEGGAGQKYIS